MGNQYSSKAKTFFARNLAESTISPPNDMPLADTDFVDGQLFRIEANEVSVHSNLVAASAGLFSNFADGLVFKNPSQRIDLILGVRAYYNNTADAFPADIAHTWGDKTITSPTGGLTGMEGVIYRSGPGSRYYFQIDSITDDSNAELTDYADIDGTYAAQRMVAGTLGLDQTILLQLPTLNTMYPIDEFLLPASLVSDSGAASAGLDLLFFAFVNNSPGHTIEFLTKSISTDYDGDSCFFDVAMNLEFTPVF